VPWARVLEQRHARTPRRPPGGASRERPRVVWPHRAHRRRGSACADSRWWRGCAPAAARTPDPDPDPARAADGRAAAHLRPHLAAQAADAAAGGRRGGVALRRLDRLAGRPLLGQAPRRPPARRPPRRPRPSPASAHAPSQPAAALTAVRLCSAWHALLAKTRVQAAQSACPHDAPLADGLWSSQVSQIRK
jgi:hypothetical protein